MVLPVLQIPANRQAYPPSMTGFCPIIKKMKDPVFENNTGLPGPKFIASIRAVAMSEDDALISGLDSEVSDWTPIRIGMYHIQFSLVTARRAKTFGRLGGSV